MQSKEVYKQFLQDTYVPIFYRPWYLDAVCSSGWDVAIVERDGEIAGVMTYMLKRKVGLSYILHPPTCPYMGPLFFGDSDPFETYRLLLRQLPYHHFRSQKYAPSLTHLHLPDTLETARTFLISADRDEDALWKSLSSERRRKIKRASEQFEMREDATLDEFFGFVTQAFGSRGLVNPFTEASFRALEQMDHIDLHRQIVAYQDKDGHEVAMAYFLMDEHSIYNIATGVDTTYRHQAMSLLLWDGISRALSENKAFDFEGSTIPGVAQLYRSFRGEETICRTTHYTSNRLIDLLVSIKMRKNKSQ